MWLNNKSSILRKSQYGKKTIYLGTQTALKFQFCHLQYLCTVSGPAGVYDANPGELFQSIFP